MKMREPKISVVIPVYNVESYLERCLESVVNQSLNDLQIILVDDGSPDRSAIICDNYAMKDSRIKVIHKSNGGLASARNEGLKYVTGKYLFFLDSDDWLELDGLEFLYNIAERYKVDFVKYRAIRTGWPGLEENAPCRVEEVRELAEGLYNRQRILEEVYPRLIATSQLTMGAVVGAWGALYRVNFILQNNLKFYEEVKFSEDLIFSANVVRAANSFYFVDKPGIYHYFYNPTSISKSFRAGRWDSCKSLIHFCERDFVDDQEYDFSKELHYLRWFCIMLALNERRYLKTYREKYKYCKYLLQDPIIRKTKLKLRLFDISWKQKAIMIMIKWRLSKLLAKI